MINDFFDSIEHVDRCAVKKALFADDAAIYCSNKSIKCIARTLQKSMDGLQMWCKEFGFKMSESKTVTMVFTKKRKHRDVNITINNATIPVVEQFKYLGVIFDHKFTWIPHIDYIVAKCQRRVGCLRAISGQKWGANKKVLLTVYKALIRSILDYGCIAFDSAAKTNLNKLDVIKNQCLRICTGTPKYTSTAAVEVDTGELPLDLRRLEIACRKGIQIQAQKSHPSAEIKPRAFIVNPPSASLKAPTFYSRVNPILSSMCLQRVFKPGPAAIPPWKKKNIQINLVLTKFESKHQTPEVIKARAMELIDAEYTDYIRIYTDASRTKKGKCALGIYSEVSATVAHPFLSHSQAYKLNRDHSIYTAELVAIRTAIQEITGIENNLNISAKFVIFSDSLSSLLSIQQEHSHSHPNILNEILTLIVNLRSTLHLVWVPSHVGIRGNETADQLAKKGLVKKRVDIYARFEPQDIFVRLRKKIDNIWQERWEASRTFYKNFCHQVTRETETPVPDRRLDTFINRLRMGSIPLNSNLQLIKKHPDGLCDSCKVPETVKHFLIHCTGPTATLVKKWFRRKRRKDPQPNLYEILNSHALMSDIYKSLQRNL
jgi:ribonuclease HI